jgi:hypothetical protein
MIMFVKILLRGTHSSYHAPSHLPFIVLFLSSSSLLYTERDRASERPRERERENGEQRAEGQAGRELAADAMARLFRESRRDSATSSSFSNGFLPSAAAAAVSSSSSGLPSPFPDLAVQLSAADLREAAYEVLVAASRTTGGKPLTYIPQASSAAPASSASSSSSASLQRSLTSAAASKMKKTLGLRSSASSKGVGSPGSGGKAAVPPRRPATVGELMRVQMRVSEPADARIRRGLLRIAASQVGSRG